VLSVEGLILSSALYTLHSTLELNDILSF